VSQTYIFAVGLTAAMACRSLLPSRSLGRRIMPDSNRPEALAVLGVEDVGHVMAIKGAEEF
jgi:hypothetical protein